MTTYTRLASRGDHIRMGDTRRVKILLGAVIGLTVLLFWQRSHCGQSEKSERISIEEQKFVDKWRTKTQLRTVYAITPTYARPVQKAELTRISHIVKLCPQIHWIIVEDAHVPTTLVADLIKRSGLEYRTTILLQPTPKLHKQNVPNYKQPRGVSQRNIALKWVREHAVQGAVFFMDDDNTYSEELFQEISSIPPGRVGVWPVGLVGGLMVEKPIVNASNIVTGFNAQWRPERPFPVDMAGFAISVDLLLANKEAKFSYDVERGYQESEILRHVTTLNNLLPLAQNCTQVLVWHTRTELPKLQGEKVAKSDKGMEV